MHVREARREAKINTRVSNALVTTAFNSFIKSISELHEKAEAGIKIAATK